MPEPKQSDINVLSESLILLCGFCKKQADVIAVNHYQTACRIVDDLLEIAGIVEYLKYYYKELKQ